MPLNQKHILSPNSEFDRREELSKALSQIELLTEEDLNILKKCSTEDHEAIGMIGCLLKDDSYINKARLIIASLNRSNTELAENAKHLLNCSDSELNNLVDKLSQRFILEDENLSNYENKIYTILFNILSQRGF